MIEINKSYFLDIAKKVNTQSYNEFASTGGIRKFNDIYDLAYIHAKLNADGYIVIKMGDQCISNITNWLVGMFEDSVKKVNLSHPLSKVAVEKNSKYFIHSALSQPIHTDEGYTNIVPRYVSLYCCVQAVNGGLSIIVPTSKLYEKMLVTFGKSTEQLFEKNCIKLYHSRGSIEKALLYRLPNNTVGISYSPVLQKLECTEEVFEMFDFISSYIHIPANQIRFKLEPGDLLLLDNFKVLHGRTKFNAHENRLLYRHWFNSKNL